MIQPQHISKEKLNKCILKASVDTVFCLTQQFVGGSNMLEICPYLFCTKDHCVQNSEGSVY